MSNYNKQCGKYYNIKYVILRFLTGFLLQLLASLSFIKITGAILRSW